MNFRFRAAHATTILTFGFLFLFVILAVGCMAPTPTPPSGPTASASRGTIRVASSGAPAIRYIPTYLAYDLLRAQGYTIEIVELARFDLVPEAIAKGDVEIGSLSPQGGWSAIANGAPLQSVVAQFAPTWAIVASGRVKGCQDLATHPVAFSTSIGVNQTLLVDYAKRTCGVTPEILVVGDSKARLAALLGGQIDATLLDLEERLQAEQQAAGKFHVILNGAREFPNLQIANFAVRREWAEQNPTVLQDFLRALLTANRQILNDPQLLREQISKHFQYDAAKSQQLADAYLAAHVWDANGGFREPDVQFTLDLLKNAGSLDAKLQVSDVANLTYLNAVLDEIGRR